MQHIRTLEILFRLDCQVDDGAIEDTQRTDLACTPTRLNLAAFFKTIRRVFREAPNLRKVIVRAPQGLRGMSDGLLSAWPPRENATIPNLDFHWGIGSPRHTHTIAAEHMRLTLLEILREMEQGKLRLDEFRILDYTNSVWQSFLAATDTTLAEMVQMRSLQSL